MFAINIRKFKSKKISSFYKKTLGLTIVCSNCGHEYKKIISTEEESIAILNSLDLRNNIEEHQKIYDHD